MRIGEVAELVGATTRAIRHYHRIGLVQEPARRANGYRDYAVDDVLRLLRVRRLVQLGMGLDDAAEVVHADDGRPALDVLQELDAELARQQVRLQERRDRLQQLLRTAPDGDTVRHPELRLLVAELSAALPDLEMADLEHRALELLAHLTPDQLPAVLAQYRAVLDDPARLARAREVDRRFAGLADRAASDDEVEAVVQLMLSHAGAPPDGPGGDEAVPGPPPQLVTDLLATSLAPAQRRCLERLMSLAQGRTT